MRFFLTSAIFLFFFSLEIFSLQTQIDLEEIRKLQFHSTGKKLFLVVEYGDQENKLSRIKVLQLNDKKHQVKIKTLLDIGGQNFSLNSSAKKPLIAYQPQENQKTVKIRKLKKLKKEYLTWVSAKNLKSFTGFGKKYFVGNNDEGEIICYDFVTDASSDEYESNDKGTLGTIVKIKDSMESLFSLDSDCHVLSLISPFARNMIFDSEGINIIDVVPCRIIGANSCLSNNENIDSSHHKNRSGAKDNEEELVQTSTRNVLAIAIENEIQFIDPWRKNPNENITPLKPRSGPKHLAATDFNNKSLLIVSTENSIEIWSLLEEIRIREEYFNEIQISALAATTHKNKLFLAVGYESGVSIYTFKQSHLFPHKSKNNSNNDN